MNILVIGGNGFIGKNLVNELLLKKHIVTVIDSNQEENHHTFIHKFEYYKLDASSKDCRDIFESGHFDAVIYAAGNTFDNMGKIYIPELDPVINTLNLCVEFNVSRFVFLSTLFLSNYDESEILNENNKNGVYYMNRKTCEQYCSTYSRVYHLNTAIVRMPPVYGPGQNIRGEGGVVLELFKSAYVRREYLPEHIKLIELLYIFDAVEELCNIIESSSSGILELRGDIIEINKLVNDIYSKFSNSIAESYRGHQPVKYSPNYEIKLDIYINTPLTFGLDKTYKWFLKFEAHKSNKTEPPKKIKKKHLILPWVENILLTLFAVWISNIIRLHFDTKILCIIIMGLLYGIKHSIISAVLSIASTDIQAYFNGSFALNLNTIETYILYFLIALLSGFSISSKKLELQQLKESYLRLEQLYASIKNNLSDTRKSASILAEQLKIADCNIIKVLMAIKKIENTAISEFKAAIPQIVREITGFKEVNFYLLSENQVPELRNPDFFKKLIEDKSIYVNKSFDVNPMIALPLIDETNKYVFGIITFNGINFDRITAEMEYLLTFLGELISHYYSFKIFKGCSI
ncbi:MAG: NAD(P)-dependent oxidoreductase [Bacillota bacterium]|nr:NAD(P)-dependent oxidoreductase [Bacillota bacterium]